MKEQKLGPLDSDKCILALPGYIVVIKQVEKIVYLVVTCKDIDEGGKGIISYDVLFTMNWILGSLKM